MMVLLVVWVYGMMTKTTAATTTRAAKRIKTKNKTKAFLFQASISLEGGETMNLEITT
jgi:hypothetical protein